MRTRHIAFTELNEVVCETVEQELTAPELGSKHSMARNAHILADLILADKLKMKSLLTGVFKPEDGLGAYERLKNEKELHLGTVFDWK